MTERHAGLDSDGLRSRLIVALAAVVTVTVLLVGAAAIVAFDRVVEPELANRTRLIGLIVRREIERVLELGIPFDAIAGLDSYLSDTINDFEEIESVAVTSRSGEALAAVRRGSPPSVLDEIGFGEVVALRQTAFALPILAGNELVGEVTVETNPLFVQTRLRDMFLDVVVIALVAILVAVELALSVAVVSVGKPLDRVLSLLRAQRDGDFRHRVRPGGLGGLGRAAARLNDHAEDMAERLAAIPASFRSAMEASTARIAGGRPVSLRLADISDIRLALFLFVAATEIAAAFLPLYARAASRPSWLSPELAGAAPLVVYLVAVAALSPFGGALVRRLGARRLFVMSVPPTVLALAFIGATDSLVGIACGRGIVAIFYAAATIACQEYAIRAGAGESAARPHGAFVAVVYGGLFCGAALGGVIAGRFGYAAAFYCGAATAILSGVVGGLAMRGTAGDAGAGRIDRADAAAPPHWFSLRFIALLVAIALPMNAATAIFIWYLTPLVLADAAFDPAAIARVVMLYYLAAVLLGPRVISISNSRVGPVALVGFGAIVSGGALLLLPLLGGFWAIVAAVAGVGVGHTMMRAPLYAVALAVTGGAPGALGGLRTIERIGAIAGLAASALLLGRVGANGIVLSLAIVVLCGAALYAISESIYRSFRR